MSLSTLDEVPLLRIFYYLPMEDLFLRVNLVCHRWNDLMPTACSQRRSLVLITGDVNNRDCHESLAHFNPFGIPFLSELKDQDLGPLNQLEDTAYSEWSTVKLRELSPKSNARLTRLLSNITSLTLIGHCPVVNYSFYYQLLWSTLIDQLVTLKIIFSSVSVPLHAPLAPTYFWEGLFGRIFGLDKLKNLNFYYDQQIECEINLMFMRKLEKFNFYLCDKNLELDVWESLRRYANRQKRQIGILNFLPKNKPNLDYDDETQLATTFTHLSFNEIINFDIGRFQNVTTVTLAVFEDSCPLSVCFLALSHLPHLIHVILQFDSHTEEDTLATLASSPKSEVELTSVKVLSFNSEWFTSRCTSVGDYASVENDIFKILYKFFPNIQYFSFFTFEFGCNSCGYCYTSQVDVEDVLPCLRKNFRRLKSVQLNNPEQRQLPLLTHIEINILLCNLYRKWSIEEL